MNFSLFVILLYQHRSVDKGLSRDFKGHFVFEFWVLRASVFVFECFVFGTTSLPERLSLRASSPIWANKASLARTGERGAEGPCPSRLCRSLARSREARFSLTQIGELARRLWTTINYEQSIIFLYKVTQGVNHAVERRSRELLNESVSTLTDFTEKLWPKNGKRGHGRSLAPRVNSLL